MKILEQIPLTEIPPTAAGRPPKYEALYQEALALDGQALVVECESQSAARACSQLFQSRGRGKRLGLAAVQRGSRIFVYRRDAAKDA